MYIYQSLAILHHINPNDGNTAGFFKVYNMDPQTFQKSGSTSQFLGTRKTTWWRFHNMDP